MELKLNLPNIIRRLKLTTKSIQSSSPIWKGLDNIQLSMTDGDPREKSALYWLFGFTLPEMHCQISTSASKLYVSEKHIKSLKQIESHITFTKLSILPLSSFQVSEKAGHIKSSEPSKTNLYEAFSHLMSVKDDLEQSYFTIGGLFLSELLKRKFVPFIENKALIESQSDFRVLDYSDEAYEIARSFVGTFVSSQNNKDKADDDSSEGETEEILTKSFNITKEKMSLICYRTGEPKIFNINLQVSYENYESSLNRTIIVDPDSQGKLEKVYNVLLETFRRNLLKCKNENKLIDAIDTNIKYINEKCSDDDFVVLTFFGNLLNIKGFEDSIFTLSKNKEINRVGDILNVMDLSNQHKLTNNETEEIKGLVVPKDKLTFKKGMVFTINSVALLKPSFFKNGEVKQNIFISISDMTLITGKRVELLTHCGRKFGKVSYFSSAKQAPKEIEIDLPIEDDTSTVVDGVRRSTRIQKALADATSKGFKAMSRIQEGLDRNKSIYESKIEKENATLISLSETKNGGSNDNNKAHLEIIEKLKQMRVNGLKNLNDFPHIKGVNTNLQLDEQRKIMFFPILGRTVPISLFMIKTVTFSEIGDVGFLRFAFNADNIIHLFQDKAKTDDSEEGHSGRVGVVEKKVQIKELVFKSKKIERLTGLYQHIRNSLKDIKVQIKEKIEKSGLIKQDTLILRNEPICLRDIQMRPVLGTRRKAQGRLEIHSNGYRFIDTQTHKIDVLFDNIQFAVFQPAFTTECFVLIHFQLKHPILANKKQTEHVQFFFDSVTSSVDIATKYSTYSGNDEQRNIKRFTAKFKTFISTAEELMSASGINMRFELPDKDLMFDVNLQRNMTPMFLCERSLLALNDTAPLLILLKDIRMVYFERMVLGSKSFDMAIIFHDIYKDVVRISNISKQESDIIKIYFEKAGVKALEGHVNMDWKTIISEIRRDPRKFAEENAWRFLEDSDGSDDEFEDKQENEEEAISSADFESDGMDDSEEEAMSGEFTGDDAVSGGNEDVSDVVDWDEETGSESG